MRRGAALGPPFALTFAILMSCGFPGSDDDTGSQSSAWMAALDGRSSLAELLPATERDAATYASPRRPHEPSGGPNEPAGFVPIAQSAKGGAGRTTGAWRIWSGEDNVEVKEDPEAPASGGFHRYRYPEGLPPGRGPMGESGWSEPPVNALEIYFTMWYRLVDTGRGNWESHEVMTKQGFFGVGNCGGTNEAYFSIQGGIRSSFDLRFHQQGPVASRSIAPLRGNVIRVGEWHRIEMHARVNDLGRRNGLLRIWVDNRLVLRERDVVWRNREHDCGFRRWVWNPTWGGMGGEPRSRDDFVDIAHVYISAPPDL